MNTTLECLAAFTCSISARATEWSGRKWLGRSHYCSATREVCKAAGAGLACMRMRAAPKVYAELVQAIPACLRALGWDVVSLSASLAPLPADQGEGLLTFLTTACSRKRPAGI